MSIRGDPNVPTLIERSSNLRDWQPWILNSQPGRIVSLAVSQTNDLGYFRARLLDNVFFGPFPNWLDLKRDFGAVGDGATDDTAALQQALDALRPWTNAPALFVPAGTYRITSELHLIRNADSESKDVIIMGDSPVTTQIVWDGPAGGTMIEFGAWYSKLGRLTLEGRGMAHTAIVHGSLFSTHNEFTDMVFQDLAFGIEAGNMTGPGNAETVVRRCRFERCSEVGVSIQDWNSLDWFIWDSTFVDCGRGVSNVYGAGNFQVYRSSFRRSTVADISIGNTCYFSIRDCNSAHSRAFFVASTNGAPALQTLQRNHIWFPSDIPIVIGNQGTLLLFDNVIDSGKGPAVLFPNPQGSVLSVGNQFTTAVPYAGQVIPVDVNNGEGMKSLPAYQPPVWPLPPRITPYLQEITPGLSTGEIQARLDEACHAIAPIKVVHFQAGTYPVTASLTVLNPAGLWIVGDGGKSYILWNGPSGGPVFHLAQPGRVQLQDLAIDGNSAAYGIVVDGLDVTGSSVTMDQTDILLSSNIGLLANGLAKTEVKLQNFYHGGSNLGVKVIGPTAAAPTSPGVEIFGGASANNQLSYDVSDGGQLLVQDVWYETANQSQPCFMICTNRGSITLCGANVGPKYSTNSQPTILLDGFQGRFTMLATEFAFPQTALSIRDPNGSTAALVIGLVTPTRPDMQIPSDNAALLNNALYTSNGSPAPLGNWGNSGHAFLEEMLAPMRGQYPDTAIPLVATEGDVRFSRVWICNSPTGIRLAP